MLFTDDIDLMIVFISGFTEKLTSMKMFPNPPEAGIFSILVFSPLFKRNANFINVF